MQTAPWENPTIEQPNIVKRGSTYYLFYSGGWWESSTYGMGYATATSRMGPYTKRTTTKAWVSSSSGANGPGGLDTFTGRQCGQGGGEGGAVGEGQRGVELQQRDQDEAAVGHLRVGQG